MSISDRILVMYEGEIVAEFKTGGCNGTGTGTLYGRVQKEGIEREKKISSIRRFQFSGVCYGNSSGNACRIDYFSSK